MRQPSDSEICPCGHAEFAQCCKRFLDQKPVPETALELMRSRYSAYVLGDEFYLKRTWYPSSRPEGKLIDNSTTIKWTGLEVIQYEQDNKWATVEFVARYKENGRARKLHEISRFVKEDGRWYYLDSDFPKTSK